MTTEADFLAELAAIRTATPEFEAALRRRARTADSQVAVGRPVGDGPAVPGEYALTSVADCRTAGIG